MQKERLRQSGQTEPRSDVGVDGHSVLYRVTKTELNTFQKVLRIK